MASGLNGVNTVTLAKDEHRESWLGRLIAHCFAYPGARDPQVITFFDREVRESLPRIVGELAAEMAGPGKSVMVHVEGTRSLECRTPVLKMSGAFLDMALQVGAPVVPVRFVGGLPAEPLASRLEFPLGMGQQDVYLGRPILPEELGSLTYKDRKERVVAAINAAGPPHHEEQPFPGNPELAKSVSAWVADTGAQLPHAVVLQTLLRADGLTPALERVVEGVMAGQLSVGSEPAEVWLGELARRLYGPSGPTVVS